MCGGAAWPHCSALPITPSTSRVCRQLGEVSSVLLASYISTTWWCIWRPTQSPPLGGADGAASISTTWWCIWRRLHLYCSFGGFGDKCTAGMFRCRAENGQVETLEFLNLPRAASRTHSNIDSLVCLTAFHYAKTLFECPRTRAISLRCTVRSPRCHAVTCSRAFWI